MHSEAGGRRYPRARERGKRLGWPELTQSQWDSTPRHWPDTTLFSVSFSMTNCCVLLLASHLTVRNQFSPLPGAGVSWPAASRHWPSGAWTEVPSSTHPDAFKERGHAAAHIACMYPGLAVHCPSFAQLLHLGFLSWHGHPGPQPTTTEVLVASCKLLSKEPLGSARPLSQLCETSIAALLERIGHSSASLVVLRRSKPST
jgi:hypothetical protein